MKSSNACTRPSEAPPSRRGLVALAVGIACGFAVLLGLGVALGIVGSKVAVLAGSVITIFGAALALLVRR